MIEGSSQQANLLSSDTFAVLFTAKVALKYYVMNKVWKAARARQISGNNKDVIKQKLILQFLIVLLTLINLYYLK